MISRLGPPEQYNDALRLSSANQFYLRTDGLNWMRSYLSLGSHKVTGMSNPEADQDGVNLGTFRASEARLLEQANQRYWHHCKRRDKKPRKHFESRNQN